MQFLLLRSAPRFAGLVSVMLALAASHGQAADAPALSLPVACSLGETCYIQNYVDVDPTAEARDYRCGKATYDGHTGIDIRLASNAAARRGVAVLAAAAGTVKGVRDGMTDQLLRDHGEPGAARQALSGRECGNGVVIDHGDGWETQYCHMRQGSLRVVKGQPITKGQALGQVGYSGLADFAHVHFTLRRHGQTLDPFSGNGLSGACARDASTTTGLWDAETATRLSYATGILVSAGFAARPPSLLELEHDDAIADPPNSTSPQLLVYARYLNVEPGDHIRIELKGPGGFTQTSETEPLAKAQAVHLAYAGKRRTGATWPTGEYEASIRLIRAGMPTSERHIKLDLREPLTSR